MKHEKTFKLKGVILTQSNLIKLMNICAPFFPEAKISVEFKDESKKSSMSVSEFENESFQNKIVKEIQIHGNVYKDGHSSTIWVRKNIDDIYVLNVEFDEYDQYVKFCDIIDKWMVEIGSRRGYINLLHSWRNFTICFAIAFMPMFLTAKSWDDIPIIALVWILPALGLGALVSSCIKHAFPLTEVDIGTNHRKTFRKFVWGVISLLLIPIILSIIL